MAKFDEIIANYMLYEAIDLLGEETLKELIIDEIHSAIDKGANINSICLGLTPLCRAIISCSEMAERYTQKHSFTIIDLLLELGSDINFEIPSFDRDYWGTALGIAVLMNDFILVKYLLDKGANPNTKNPNLSAMAVVRMIDNHEFEEDALYQKPVSQEIIELLKEHEARTYKPITKELKGATSLLDEAIIDKDIKSIKNILTTNADKIKLLNSPNDLWETPLILAISRCCYEYDFTIIELLLEQGADINYEVDVQGFYSPYNFYNQTSALNYAISRYDIRMVKYLLDKGANPNGKILPSLSAVKLQYHLDKHTLDNSIYCEKDKLEKINKLLQEHGATLCH